MIERADTMANRLETSVRSARGEIRGEVRGAEPKGEPRAAGQPGRQQWAGGGNVVGTAGLPGSGLGAGASGGRASQQATLAAIGAQGDDGEDERSEAERELLRALQSMR
jgi:hypothetical protein